MKRFACLLSCLALGLFAEEEVQWVPTIHLYVVGGGSTADDAAEFAPGAHDPGSGGDFMLQAFEPGLSFYSERFQAFVNGVAFTNEEEELDWEFEEYFGKVLVDPEAWEIRGGRFLNRLGFHNSQHLHSRLTLEVPLTQALLLGEHGQVTEGVDTTFYVNGGATALTFSFGNAPSHEHAHGHEEEEEHHDEEGEEHDEDEHEDEEHGHEDEHGHGGPREVYEAYWLTDDVYTVDLRHRLDFDDFKKLHLAAFAGFGDNEMGESSYYASVAKEYVWRENGLEAGGRSLSWRSELILLNGDGGEHGHDDEHEEEEHEEEEHEDEHEHGEEESEDLSTWGFGTQVQFSVTEQWSPYARFDYIAGDAGAGDWVRGALGVKFYLTMDPEVTFKLQGTADDQDGESAQAIWLQAGFSWGGPEVR